MKLGVLLLIAFFVFIAFQATDVRLGEQSDSTLDKKLLSSSGSEEALSLLEKQSGAIDINKLRILTGLSYKDIKRHFGVEQMGIIIFLEDTHGNLMPIDEQGLIYCLGDGQMTIQGRQCTARG